MSAFTNIIYTVLIDDTLIVMTDERDVSDRNCTDGAGFSYRHHCRHRRYVLLRLLQKVMTFHCSVALSSR